jgi:hypothetical protein
MNSQRCINCSEYKRCKESSVSWVFFIIGIIATIAVRVVTVLIHVNPLYGQIAWYIGVAGFLVFFVYKFRVDHTRSRLIRNSKLMNKISQSDKIEKDDRALISSVLCALSSNKDSINYFVIFISSAIALVIAVYFDFFR